ncbi:ComF family protein [Cohnella sp. LGH]|uniref:ComF family protein n=1 Tax=Cohnella sp. LGH TaxID=1619153 RepID=UPI001AD983DC|nr:ComF family protein [Cohnella sp. LGH]QTH42300.1 ComF family protein [Cohnella sp. LGH]
MPINIGAWFAPAKRECPICGRDSRPAAVPIPVKNSAPRKALASLCGSCLQNIPWIANPVCRVCGRAELCEDCVRRTERFYAISRCAVRYTDEMKNWLALYKYRGNEGVETILAAMAAFAFERLRAADPQAHFPFITAVPLAPERLRERGFNQAERLAVRLAQWYGMTYQPLLLRLRHTEKQSLKTRRSRVVDMKGNFAAAHRSSFSGNILVLDDVYTTGSTLDECARVLLQASEPQSERRIYGLLWARS